MINYYQDSSKKGLNPYALASHLWYKGEHQESLEVFQSYFDEQLGQDVFIPSNRLVEGRVDTRSFEQVMTLLINNSNMLIAPFAKMFPLLWRFYPHQYAIAILKAQKFDFTPTLPFDDDIIELMGLTVDVVNTELAIQKLAELVIKEVERGIIVSDLTAPYSGHVKFSVQDINEIPDKSWGQFKYILLEKLPSAFDRCPDNVWHRLVKQKPEFVLERFLHEIFLHFHPTLDTSFLRLQRMIENHSQYSNSLINAIDYLLESDYLVSNLEQIMKYDVNIICDSPLEWFQCLRNSFHEANVEKLINCSKERFC